MLDTRRPEGEPEDILKQATARALAFLAEGGGNGAVDASLLKYSVGRFKVGLPRFADILDRVGCAPGAALLDLGCGAGNWSVAHAIRSADRARIVAVDRRDGFVKVGAEVARTLGLTGIVFRCGSAEDEAMYGPAGSADFILANSFLMFVDADRVLAHMAKALSPQGALYGNYTTAAGRVASVLVGVEKGIHKAVSAGMHPILGTAMTSLGLRAAHPSEALTERDLLDLFRVWGFRLRESPGVHDWSNPLASRGVVDFVFDRGAAETALPPARLLEIGAHRAAVARCGDAPAERDVKARALIAGGGAAAGAALSERLPEGATARAVLLVQRFLEGAVKAPATLAALDEEGGAAAEPHIAPFLKGAVLLRAGDAAAARRAFAAASQARPAWPGGWAGEISALCHGRSNVDAAIGPLFARMVEAAELGLTAADEALRRRAAALAP
jgi:SAM-dependent methyltransferase